MTNSGSGGFRLNGVADGANTATTFTQPISTIGSRGGAEYFSGSITEIDIYTNVLTTAQISNVEATLTNSYITALPSSAPTVLVQTAASPNPATIGGNATFSAIFTGTSPISYQWQASTNATGIGATNIPGATNSTVVISNLQSTFYYSLMASNSVAPNTSDSAWLQVSVVPLTALVQLKSTNYNPSTGIWTDSSGNGNNATYDSNAVVATPTTLVSLATPNGAPAVNFPAGPYSFLLTSNLPAGNGYTVFAYMKANPANNTRSAITGGSAAVALEYDIYNNSGTIHQDYLTEYTTDVGHGNAVIPTTNFNLVDLAVNSSGASFRCNGASDGTLSGASFTQPITRFGNNHGYGDNFVGQIAEVDVYSGVLSAIQISNIEAQLTASYITANSILIGPASATPGTTYAGNPVTLSAQVIGASPTTTFQWQTDNGSSGVSWANIMLATNTNYVLNTTGLLGNYEYQLIGTPFGGASITDTPVTLTVLAASAPVVTVQTAASANPGTAGGNDTFSASFAGNLPISYQWQYNSTPSSSGATSIPGATNTTLVLTNLLLANSGLYYSLQASNAIAPNVSNSAWLQLIVQPLTPMVQLQAANYNQATGVWTDSSGNSNNASYAGGLYPPLTPSATPNGSSVVYVSSGGGSFVLTSPLAQSNGYTVFAYVEPSQVTTRCALTGGSNPGALEYDFYGGEQDYLIEYLSDQGNGNATISTTNFSLVDVAVNSSGASFRLNGASDGNVSGATFSQPITRIGNNEGFGDSFTGEISEIDVYSGVLSALQVSNVEAQLTASYINPLVSLTPSVITATLSNNVLQLSWPSANLGYRLLVQTNNLAQGISENLSDWATVPGSTAVDQTNITIDPTLPAEFYQLVYP